jgi:hypothetical protein
MSDKTTKTSGLGIGEAGSVPASTPQDEIEAERLQPAPKPVEYGTCQRCKCRISKRLLMWASRGLVCPDCYDAWSD